jgi:hypothetical protein
MRKHAWLASAIALVSVLVATGVSWAGSGISGPTELDFTLATCGAAHTKCTYVDTGSHDRVAGDILADRSILFDANDHRAGTTEATCIAVTELRFRCGFTESLHDGTIELSGVFLTNGVKGDLSDLGTFAVTGGTGTYEGVGGYATFGLVNGVFTRTIFLVP